VKLAPLFNDVTSKVCSISARGEALFLAGDAGGWIVRVGLFHGIRGELNSLWAQGRIGLGRHSRALAAIALSVLTLGSAWGFASWYLALDERLGALNFPISCSWQSQREFTVAMSLLHLFQFTDAEKLYAGIARSEPDCAMAYWGIAMSRLQNPLYATPTPADAAVARQAIVTADAAPRASRRERAYIAAARVLFAPGSTNDWHSRFVAYAPAMGKVVTEFPEDREATIFYALALNLSESPTVPVHTARTKAAELLLQVFSEEPNHPGISHYLTFCLGHAGYQPKPFERVSMTKPIQRVIMGAFAFLTLLGIGGFVIMTSDHRPGASSPSEIGGPFVLMAGDATVVTDQTFRGHWMLVYFGYTHCPDICPTTLLAIGQAMQKLGPLAADVRPIFISIDPDRDSPQVIDEFVKSFDARIIGLTGNAAAIAALAKQYHVFYKKEPIEGSDDYFMEHSSYIYVMDPNGRYVTLFTHSEESHEIASRLRELLVSPPSDKHMSKLFDVKTAPSSAKV
jgi:protein SCO1